MANHPSALKRHRQSVKRGIRNDAVRTEIRSLRKKVLRASKKSEAEKSLKELVSAFHVAARKSVIHSNAANRSISRLTRFVNTIK